MCINITFISYVVFTEGFENHMINKSFSRIESTQKSFYSFCSEVA